MLTMDIATQIYTILKQPDVKFLTQVFSFVLYIHFFSFLSSTLIGDTFVAKHLKNFVYGYSRYYIW